MDWGDRGKLRRKTPRRTSWPPRRLLYGGSRVFGLTSGLQPMATYLVIGAYMSQSTAVRELKKRLGRRVDTSRTGCWAASFDSSKISFLPEAVVTPRAEADIGAVLELANRHRVPVTVRG